MYERVKPGPHQRNRTACCCVIRGRGTGSRWPHSVMGRLCMCAWRRGGWCSNTGLSPFLFRELWGVCVWVGRPCMWCWPFTHLSVTICLCLLSVCDGWQWGSGGILDKVGSWFCDEWVWARPKDAAGVPILGPAWHPKGTEGVGTLPEHISPQSRSAGLGGLSCAGLGDISMLTQASPAMLPGWAESGGGPKVCSVLCWFACLCKQ
jgi:hypothetical protein